MRKHTIQATVYMAAFLLAGCAQDPPAPQRRCVLQETGVQVPDSRCEGAGEPGVTTWYWVQNEVEIDFDDGHGAKKHKVTKGTYIPPKTTTRRR